MLDQFTLDLLASLDYYRIPIPEIELFNNFFMHQFSTHDLGFYLLLRSQGEKELGSPLHK